MRTPYIALALHMLITTAHAEGASVQSCRNITDATSRLSCYDRIVLVTATDSQPRQNPETFGMARVDSAGEIGVIETTLADAIDGWQANEVISLENGQKWQIADDSSGVTRPGERKVRIRRGMLGAFYIEFAGINGSPRVRRIK